MNVINTKSKMLIRAARPFSLTGSVIPVTLGAMLAIHQSKFSIVYFIFSVIGIILLQASINLLNDHDDFINKVDTKDSYCSSGVVVEGLITANEVKKAGIIALVLGCIVGLLLGYFRGSMILIIGLVGAICGYFYTGKPLALKYRGLGAPLVFVIFGPLMTLGSYYVQAQELGLKPLLISIPVGLLTTAILHANDIRDIRNDSKAGIKTLSIVVGRKNADRIYISLIVFAYISIPLISFYNYIPYLSLICLLTIPKAAKNIKKLTSSNNENKIIADLDKETAKLQSQFGVLLILSMLVSIAIL
ncbi:1,4-dihydroxy-2-naphthoate octaprenyltransferase [Clostridium folliculivorans]|uniref:1,4-dihydroxy-2-naphthoate octaprenyltransferase n=2 Tax=Clostridium folliculivorans TaxID=2886038 RepID=A0A9W6D9P7_9CLOT|nr:1,4-dihydroxy-2-naphthoate octaprenyltransferase [Clostridium folliculivorans]GKU30653.1 1,4-dihydroxy-2-naphthoate octaprenyltransferase [Clostridium folliculivorans]